MSQRAPALRAVDEVRNERGRRALKSARRLFDVAARDSYALAPAQVFQPTRYDENFGVSRRLEL